MSTETDIPPSEIPQLSHPSCRNTDVTETDIAQMTHPVICKYTQILDPSSRRLVVRCERLATCREPRLATGS